MLRSGQIQVRSGLVLVWFSLKLKFNSLELDSVVGQLVATLVGVAMSLECDREGCEEGAWCML